MANMPAVPYMYLHHTPCHIILTPFMPSGLFHINSLDQTNCNRRGVCLVFLLLLCFIESPVFNANSIDPDQTLCSVASDQGLNCLPMSLLRDAMHKWVKNLKKSVLLTVNMYEKNVGLMATSADSDKTPRSDLGLHRLLRFVCLNT